MTLVTRFLERIAHLSKLILPNGIQVEEQTPFRLHAVRKNRRISLPPLTDLLVILASRRGQRSLWLPFVPLTVAKFAQRCKASRSCPLVAVCKATVLRQLKFPPLGSGLIRADLLSMKGGA